MRWLVAMRDSFRFSSKSSSLCIVVAEGAIAMYGQVLVVQGKNVYGNKAKHVLVAWKWEVANPPQQSLAADGNHAPEWEDGGVARITAGH